MTKGSDALRSRPGEQDKLHSGDSTRNGAVIVSTSVSLPSASYLKSFEHQFSICSSCCCCSQGHRCTGRPPRSTKTAMEINLYLLMCSGHCDRCSINQCLVNSGSSDATRPSPKACSRFAKAWNTLKACFLGVTNSRLFSPSR